jgi:hypothetical protein
LTLRLKLWQSREPGKETTPLKWHGASDFEFNIETYIMASLTKKTETRRKARDAKKMKKRLKKTVLREIKLQTTQPLLFQPRAQ